MSIMQQFQNAVRDLERGRLRPDLPVAHTEGPAVPTGYVVGVDLGQARDYTAVVVNERHEASRVTRQTRGFPGSPDYEDRERRDTVVYHRLTFLHRFQLGTPYPEITQAVRKLLGQLPAMQAPPALVVDASGVGRPVLDDMRKEGLRPIGVTITGGAGVTRETWDNVRVAKQVLASVLQVVLQGQRLKFAEKMELLPILTRELENFKVKISPAGTETYEAGREGEHDDLVLAAALAVWRAEDMTNDPKPARSFHTNILAR